MNGFPVISSVLPGNFVTSASHLQKKKLKVLSSRLLSDSQRLRKRELGITKNHALQLLQLARQGIEVERERERERGEKEREREKKKKREETQKKTATKGNGESHLKRRPVSPSSALSSTQQIGPSHQSCPSSPDNDVLNTWKSFCCFSEKERIFHPKHEMLEYEWGNPASILLPGEDVPQDNDQGRQIFDPFNQTLAGNLLSPTIAFSSHHHHHHQQLLQQQQNQTFFDSRANALSQPRTAAISPSQAPTGFSHHSPFELLGNRNGDFSGNGSDIPARIGLNLGVRTYFSSADDDFVSRLYRRPRPVEPPNPPRCQAEGCVADLTHAKHYHRRHKVCEFHSKASTVIANGLTQRFCQQCSRFHPLSEFDQGKRSCRKRLADHNRRRRKSQSQPQFENPRVSLAPEETPPRSSPESGTRSSSSASVAVSPPRIALDCFRLTNSGSVLASSSNSRLSLFEHRNMRDGCQ